MDFPAATYEACEAPKLLTKALGIEPIEFYCNKKYLAVFGSEAQVRDVDANMGLLKQLELDSLVITAKGEHVDLCQDFLPLRKALMKIR